jgi:hypothetical protein
MIARDAKMVIVSEIDALDRLRDHLPLHGIEMRPFNDFLVGYDRETLEGEENLRRMEALYASLRGKLVVRLMRVNLNPEVIRVHGDRLQQLREGWTQIESRLAELLRERQNERICFVTILITEEGDWTDARRDILESFSCSHNESCFSMRCYLMTRLLELGHDRVIHARHAWPTFVAGLLCHFLWRDDHAGLARDGERRRFMEVDGLFAWRTLQVVASVPDNIVREKFRDILSEITRKFFGERPGPLFPEMLRLDSSTSLGSPFKRCVDNPFANKQWNELGEPDNGSRDELQSLEDPAKWKLATETHAATERVSSWNDWKNETVQAISEVGLRINEAKDVPGRLFPGALPSQPIQGLPEPDSILQEIEGKLVQMEKRTAQLREWWFDHVQAARGFVVTKERWIVAIIVSIALSYGILSVQLAIQKYLPGEVFPLNRGLMITGASVAGVALMLLIGYLTQRWRGSLAQAKLVQSGDEWIKASEQLRETVANSLRYSRQAGARIREATARKQLVKRLNRIEQILTSELQVSSLQENDRRQPIADEGADGILENYRNLLEVVVDSNPENGFQVVKLVEQTTEDFFREWKQLLNKSSDRVMIPAATVLGLCQKSVSGLRHIVESELRESAASRLSQSNNEIEDVLKTALKTAQIDGDERHFYSVDLKGGVPRDSVWFRRGLQNAFPLDRFEKVQEMEASKLTKGTLAVLYGECPLRVVGSQGNGRLEFEANYSSSSQMPELGGEA